MSTESSNPSPPSRYSRPPLLKPERKPKTRTWLRSQKPLRRSKRPPRASNGGKNAKRPTKPSKAALKRLYGLPEKLTTRYEGNVLKGIYWTYLGRYIRMRDFLRYGRCISCNRPASYDELQAGHFAPASSCGFALLFDERNLNGECGGCNAFNQMHLLGYARNLDHRYGVGTADSLQKRYSERHSNTQKEWTSREYEQKIPEIRAKLYALVPGDNP